MITTFVFLPSHQPLDVGADDIVICLYKHHKRCQFHQKADPQSRHNKCQHHREQHRRQPCCIFPPLNIQSEISLGVPDANQEQEQISCKGRKACSLETDKMDAPDIDTKVKNRCKNCSRETSGRFLRNLVSHS